MRTTHNDFRRGPMAINTANLANGSRYSTEWQGNAVSWYYEHGKHHVIGYNQNAGRVFWAVLDTFTQARKVFKGYEKLILTRRLLHLEDKNPVRSVFDARSIRGV